MVAEAEAALAAVPVEAVLEAADLAEDLAVLADPCVRIMDLECHSFSALDFTAEAVWAD